MISNKLFVYKNIMLLTIDLLIIGTYYVNKDIVCNNYYVYLKNNLELFNFFFLKIYYVNIYNNFKDNIIKKIILHYKPNS